MEIFPTSSIIFCDKKYVQKITFSETMAFIDRLKKFLNKLDDNSCCCIGLLMEKNIMLPILIESILKLKFCFIFLNLGNIKEAVKYLNIKWVISCNSNSVEDFQLISNIKLEYVIEYKLWKNTQPNTSNQNLDFKDIFCVMMSSGTTGESKFVRIPNYCIESNVKSLQNRFKVTSEDIILWGTPLTFDPTLVEILLFFYAKATILFTSEITFLNPEYLLEVILHNRVTVVQMVPSVFFRWNSAQITNLLNNCSLRVLAFGGEPFPKQILNFKKNPNLNLYNLYGITELSCWASIHKITNESFKHDISIGEIIGDTFLEIRDVTNGCLVTKGIGEICVGSNTRYCLVNDYTKSDIRMPIATGDLAEVNGRGIFYKGRKNRVFKRLGQKVNLSKIEENILKETGLSNRSVFYNGKLLLFILIEENFNPTAKRKLLDKFRVKLLKILAPKEFPDYIDVVLKFPLTNHGKISDKMLENYYLHHLANKSNFNYNCLEEFDYLSKKYFGKDIETIKNFTFEELGVNSIATTQFLAELEDRIGTKIPSSLVSILFEKPLKECRSSLKDIKVNHAVKRKMLEEENRPESECELDEIDIIWKYDLKACVDCSPLVFEFKGKIFIAVGSFSRIFVVLDENGNEYLKIDLPDNIEATSCLSERNGLIFVGCYDGNIYAIDLATKEISWLLHTDAKIKSRPGISRNNEAIVVGSYDTFVYCVCQKTGKEIWKTTLKGPICADIVCSKNKIYVSTLKGICCCLDQDGSILWSYDTESPLFGTHVIHEDVVIWPAVTGNLHCTFADNGSLIWKIKVDGHIFSTSIVLKNKMYVGCHDSNLYQFDLTDLKQCPKILKKHKLRSEISTTPFLCNESFLVFMCNSGHLYIMSTTSDQVIFEGQLPNQCFSSPYVYRCHVYVGCRNNFLYKIKLAI